MDIIKNSCSSGELSPEMAGRVDLPEYYQGCRTLEGFIVAPTGGAERRPGFEVVGWTNGGASIGGEL
jgi:hypothetical protein